ncbi:hypothetical protein [Flavihumibacter fluvii]|jgi:hypothetical protein|uniref:hypothetical protein n=1 Tax=Flavihumibacter fluvii TaxID=2838157 RepID=UPI001BDDDF4F|nr:hypothetical protein [Flavihumibacter fluvii]ULQ51101.1 hypothetical protein KJS93_13515 [Flavihumibacter fluvii]
MHITVHLGLLALVVFFAFAFGVIFRLLQVRSLRRQILELEKDKMQDHSEILQLQRKLAEQQQRLNSPVATPVVPLKEKESGKSDEGKGIRATQ